MIALVRQILTELTDDPAQLELTEVSGAKTVIYELHSSPEDAGKVIGKNGKTISAIRTLLNAIALRDGKKVVFEVIE